MGENSLLERCLSSVTKAASYIGLLSPSKANLTKLTDVDDGEDEVETIDDLVVVEPDFSTKLNLPSVSSPDSSAADALIPKECSNVTENAGGKHVEVIFQRTLRSRRVKGCRFFIKLIGIL